MAYNTKAIKTDVDKKPIPQYYNPVTDEYDVLQGAAGAARHILYGADGNPISTSAGKLAVRASEIETLIGEVQAAPTANTLLARLKNLETKIDAIIAGTTPATVQLSGRKGVIKSIALTDTSEVAAGAYVNVSTVVPANKKWTILEWSMAISPPTGGESGSHRVLPFFGDVAFVAFNIIMPFDKRFDYSYSQFVDGGTGSYLTPITLFPDDKAVHYNLLKGSILTSSCSLIFRYYNNTDVAQTIARYFRILVLEEGMTA